MCGCVLAVPKYLVVIQFKYVTSAREHLFKHWRNIRRLHIPFVVLYLMFVGKIEVNRTARVYGYFPVTMGSTCLLVTYKYPYLVHRRR